MGSVRKIKPNLQKRSLIGSVFEWSFKKKTQTGCY